ncbi:hypothetical protein [Microbacterium rhizophilus]|uniref:hypothetical protein n=1 Tax=Microbacterium rhizophilus TaxID=3138934 RepID=UPI0031E9F2BE
MTTIEQRCGDLVRPVLELMGAAVSAGFDASAAQPALRAVQRLRDILAEGTDGIASAAYLQWHATADDMLASVARELENGDVPAARAILSDPRLGLQQLSIACAGMPGW